MVKANIMEDFLDIKSNIERARSIGIVTKNDANEDAIGATLALFFALKSAGKKAFFPVEEIPGKITEILKRKEHKKFHISFKEDVSEVYYEKSTNGIDLYLTPKKDDVDEENFSYKVVSGMEYLLNDDSSDYDILFTIGIGEFAEVEKLCDSSLDQLYACTVINIDNSLNNQNYGEINMIEEKQSLSQTISCLIKSLGQEYTNKEVMSLILLGLTSSQKNIQNKKNIPTIKWLLRNGGELNTNTENRPKTKLLESVLQNLTFLEEESIYISTISENNLLENKATSKDLAFAVEKVKNFFKIPSFLLLWESRTSPLSVKGLFYSDQKGLVEKVAKNFKSISKGNGTMFLTEQNSIDSAKEKIMSCLR